MRNTHQGSTHQQDPEAMNTPIRYKGYEVAPSAQRLPNGLYAANLTIGTLATPQTPSQPVTASGTLPDTPSAPTASDAAPPPNTANTASTADSPRSTTRGALVSFDALDYFFDERHALAYACRWARMWIDEQRRCA